MKESEGFWLSYIDVLTVLISILIIGYVGIYEGIRIKNENSAKFVNAWEEAENKLAGLGAKPRTKIDHGGWQLEIAEDILFPINESRLNENGLALIKKIAAIIREFVSKSELVSKTIRIIVGGHTDISGPKWFNVVLSEERASAVYTILKGEINAPELQMEWIGYGFRYPKEGAKNAREHRRISITIQPIAVEYIR